MSKLYSDFYDFAKKFLLEKIQMHWISLNEAKEILQNMTHNPVSVPNEKIDSVMCRLIESLYNAGMKPNVIWKPFEKHKSQFKTVLFDFNPQNIFDTYEAKEEELYGLFCDILQIQKVDNKRNMRRQFAFNIVSASKFLYKFKNTKEFDEFVNGFLRNEDTIETLPMILKSNISWYGLALASDFLKELWYMDFAKPDVHIMDILEWVWILTHKNDYEALKKMREIAKEIDITPYELDKILWLIWSWKIDKSNISLWNNKKEFIQKYNELYNSN